jgi:hypothetical protein
MTGIGWVGAMLKRGAQSSSPETAIPQQSAFSSTVDSVRTLGDYGRSDAPLHTGFSQMFDFNCLS